jgi:hypothetical protein
LSAEGNGSSDCPNARGFFDLSGNVVDKMGIQHKAEMQGTWRKSLDFGGNHPRFNTSDFSLRKMDDHFGAIQLLVFGRRGRSRTARAV